MAQHAQYIDRMKNASVMGTAMQLGLELRKHPGNQSPASFPCPVCSAEFRHSEKGQRARFACGVKPGDAGWHCFSCRADGDALDLVGAVKFQNPELKSLRQEQKDQVREWITGERACDIPRRQHPAEPHPPSYPPRAAIMKYWNACVRVDEDAAVSLWLAEHKIDVTMAADREWARAITSSSRHHWAIEGRRVIAPLRDVDGEIVSLKARGMTPGSKSRPPKGFATAKLCFFDPTIKNASRVIFVEGEKKFMQLSTLYPEASVIGVMNGSVTEEYAKLVPPEAEVWVLTDWNQAGADYATVIYNRALRNHEQTRIRLRKGFVANRERSSYRIELIQGVTP